jgi:hypothetical protein
MWKSSRWASRCASSCAAVLVTLSSPLVSQEPSASDSPRRELINRDVRVRAPSLGKLRIRGRVDRATPDTLVVRAVTRSGKDTLWTIPASAIARLEVSYGRRSNALRGLGYGLLGGAVIGAGLGAISCRNDDELGPGFCAIVGGIVYGVGGAVVGLIAGALTRRDRWVDVPAQPGRLSVDLRPRGGSLRIGAVFAF